jgi:N-acetylmuramic acid 6-phosphate etherase
MVQTMQREDRAVIAAVRSAVAAVASAIDAIEPRFRAGGRLIYIGAGTSGRLGVLDAAECPPTFGIAPGRVMGIIAGGARALRRSVEGAEDDPAGGQRDLEEVGLKPLDCVVGIAASGRTPYTLGAVRYARQRGCLTLALTCVPHSALAQAAEIAIELPTGAEAIAGSTRMKAGSAQKMALNLLSTGLMVRLGRTHGNLMAYVLPTNRKLQARARRIRRAIGKSGR